MAAASASAPAAAELWKLFRDLDDAVKKDGDYEKALSITDKILQVDGKDKDALASKITCLVHLGRFDDALGLIDAKSQPFLRAYCLYRQKKLPAALEAISSVPPPKSVEVLELEAQIQYSMEHFNEAVALYEELLNKHKIDTAELKTNLSAAYSLAGKHRENLALLAKNKKILKESFEYAFNSAFGFLGIGDLKEAERHLVLARETCRATLQADEAGEDEIQQELAGIQVLLGYTYQLQGRDEDAINIYSAVSKQKDIDAAVGAVASNNFVSLHKEHLFESLKKLNHISKEAEAKLTAPQRRAISFNKCLLLLHMNKGKECRELLDTLVAAASTPEEIERPALIAAALHFKEKKLSEAGEVLKSYVARHPQSTAVPLALAQIQLSAGDLPAAVAALRSIEPLRHRLGTTAVIATLSEATGDIDGALSVWDAAVEYWVGQRSGGKNAVAEETYRTALRRSAELKLRHRRFREAAAVYERQIKLNPNDLEALPGLVIAAAAVDPKQAEKHAERLPAISKEKEVDADAIEAEFGGVGVAQAGAAAAASTKDTKAASAETGLAKEPRDAAKAAAAAERRKLKRKKKKKRLPKNYDPSIPPDAERWVPKRMRSSFRGRRGKKTLRGGAQGTVIGVEPQPAAAASPPVPSPAKPSSPASPAKSAEAPKQPPASSGSKKGGKKRRGR